MEKKELNGRKLGEEQPGEKTTIIFSSAIVEGLLEETS